MHREAGLDHVGALGGRGRRLPRFFDPGLGAPLHFIDRDVLLVRADDPHVSERIGETSGAVAVELIGDGNQHLGPGADGALGEGVDVFDVQLDGYCGAAERLRAEVAPCGRLRSNGNAGESPTWISACTTWPFGSEKRISSVAPKAR